jgi:hypothetical protein
MDQEKLKKLRLVITENLRVQRGGAKPVTYIDTMNALTDICARQNHAVFARRGCGKTLLLHDSGLKLPEKTRAVYLNCEDFKTHSFPNVLIEILDTVFGELEKNLTGWFGRQKASREIIAKIRSDLAALKHKADERDEKVTEARSSQSDSGAKVGASSHGIGVELSEASQAKISMEREYLNHDNKLRELNMWLPKLKGHIRDFFAATKKVDAVFIQVDDFYHLRRADQPHVMDYLHRLCKDLPLYFKVATLRHASTLYADRDGQPTGAQERHDYQPINIDFSFHDFRRTENQVRRIFHEFGKLAGCAPADVDDLFKGDGFRRLVLTGGGVPRDCLSLFLEALGAGTSDDGRIGKDDIRALSSGNFERRIEELEHDCERGEKDTLLRGIYVLRKFVLARKTNVFMIEERMLQQEDALRALVYRLLDYRIIHSVGSALTHKSQQGTYQAFSIDAGCYGHMRKLDGRFNEIDLGAAEAREKARSAPVLSKEFVKSVWTAAPTDVHNALLTEEPVEVMQQLESGAAE